MSKVSSSSGEQLDGRLADLARQASQIPGGEGVWMAQAINDARSKLQAEIAQSKARPPKGWESV
jgi:hypothetical protein